MSVIDFLRNIIEIPSLSGEEKKVASRIKGEFGKLRYDEVIEAGGNICGRIGSGGIKILYDAHMDVVEPGKNWTGEPFRARMENGYIYGRGACDDKGSLAAIVHGGAAAKTDGVTLYVLCSVNEEVAEGNGLRDFLGSTGISPDYIVIAEPSSLRLARGNRGRLALRIDVRGEAGHASNPSIGINAIYRSVGIIDRIKELNSRLDGDSVVVTKTETPNKNINIIPESCSIYCDYRTRAGRTREDILKNIGACIGEDDSVSELTPYYKPWQMDPEHLLVRAGSECASGELGRKEIITWDFCTNGSYTAGELGIPTIGFGPGEEKEAHAAEEKISAAAVKDAVRFFSSLPGYVRKNAV
ncbi:MAG: M20/M25/M40 family metallo-hydrolase [Elusimicrobia bacterium]|nr:M20/M25/M40 family metallo-hydrolase [Elusimicrobiota bacterium]